MSTDRTIPEAGWARPSRLPRGPNGRALCRNCHEEVPTGRRTFCGDACVEAWKLRSDAGHQRRRVYERDRGVCASCGLDTEALRRAFLWAQGAVIARTSRTGSNWQTAPEILPLRPDEQARAEALPLKKWWLAKVATGAAYHAPEIRALLLGFDPGRQSWWDMDHEKPVVEGGGVSLAMAPAEVLAGLRTLCLPCHKRATADLARRRAEARREAVQPSLALPRTP